MSISRMSTLMLALLLTYMIFIPMILRFSTTFEVNNRLNVVPLVWTCYWGFCSP